MPSKRGKRMWDGDKVRALRMRFGETQAEFGERLGVSVQAVSWWEQNRGKPSGPAEKLLTMLQQQLDQQPAAASA